MEKHTIIDCDTEPSAHGTLSMTYYKHSPRKLNEITVSVTLQWHTVYCQILVEPHSITGNHDRLNKINLLRQHSLVGQILFLICIHLVLMQFVLEVADVTCVAVIMCTE